MRATEQRQQQRLRRLLDANAEMVRSLDLGHRLRNAVKAVRDLVPADAAAIFFPDATKRDVLVIAAQDGLSMNYASRQRIALADVRAQFRGAGDHLVLDLPSGSVGDHDLIRAEGLAKVLSLPLFRGDELMGVIAVYSKDPARVFDIDDIEIANLLAANTAIGVANSRLYAQALANEELQRRLLDALSDGVIIAYPDGRYEANPRAREVLGFQSFDSLAELQAAIDLRERGSGESVSHTADPLDRALRGETTSGGYLTARVEDRTEIELEVSAAPVRGPDGSVVAAVMALRDTTDLRAAEREREQFLSIVSHELRTPLTPLKALAQLVRTRMRRSKQQGTPLDLESLERNLAGIERQVDRMNGLVNDLLSVSRAEKGSLRMEPVEFDLAVLVRDVTERYIDATAEEGRHSFTVDAPARLLAHGDQSRVEQLLMNLVGNAVKYSPTGGDIRVTVTADGPESAITIADTGIGIPAEDLPRLGHPFVRGAGRAGTFAGLGVGLYVARIVAEAHAGSLKLESDGDGKGTTVRVRLPL